ncbi:MAG: porin family protein [Bacteroidales bacterium]|nr:porin family protein [Bacteroidales bacterium]
MKKIFKTFMAAVAFASVTTSADAQLFLTGNFGMSNTSGENEVLNKSSKTDSHNVFHFGVEAGYYFSDNMAFGLEIRYNHDKVKNAADKKKWTADNGCEFNPYFRYDFIASEKVNFGVKAKGIFGFGKEKDQDNDHTKNSEIGFGFFPVLNYKFNSKWGAGVEFGSLYYLHTTDKPASGDAYKNTTNRWSTNISLESLRFSVVYTF